MISIKLTKTIYTETFQRKKMLVDYDEIIEDYQNSIQTKLRGFKPKHDFLEMWVHDEDHALSILNIVESAEINNISDLSIQVSEKIWKELDPVNLKSLIEELGTVQIDDENDNKLIRIKMG